MSDAANRTQIDDETREALREIEEAQGGDAMKVINDRIRSVLEEAPSDSTAELLVRRTRDGYKGLLKVYSQQRKFVGGQTVGKFADLIEQLFSEVHEQIEDWKRGRFNSPQPVE